LGHRYPGRGVLTFKETGATCCLRVRAQYDAENCHPLAFSICLYSPKCVEG
jgi:hypothetical protein